MRCPSKRLIVKGLGDWPQDASGEIATLRARLSGITQVLQDERGYLEFRDPYQITWQIILCESTIRTSGEFANRWLGL